VSSLVNWVLVSWVFAFFLVAPTYFDWQWADIYGWPRRGWQFTVIPIPVFLWGNALVLILSLAQLPLIHVTGRIRTSIFRAWSSVISVEGGLSLFVGCILCLVHFWAFLDDIAINNSELRELCDIIQVCCVAVGIIGLCWLFSSLDRAGGAMLAIGENPISTVHCEDCGYNLESIAVTGRCPECGSEAAVSLDDQYFRRGVAWESTLALQDYLRSNVKLIFRPRELYYELRMRPNLTAAWQFARLNYLFAGIACAVVQLVLVRMTTLHLSVWQEAVRIFLVGFLGLILFWVYHRLIGAVAGIVAILSGIVPDFDRVRKIWLYESAFVWVVLVVQVAGLSLLLIYPRWFSDTVVFYMPAFVRDDLVSLMAGAFIFLSLLALYRYYQAIKITRWSNF